MNEVFINESHIENEYFILEFHKLIMKVIFLIEYHNDDEKYYEILKIL